MKHPSGKWLWLLPALLALAVNFNVLQNEFAWDDVTMSVGQERPGLGINVPKIYYRPAVSWSLRLDRWMWKTEPAGYHLTGLLLHALVTLLVTLIGLRLFSAHPQKKFIVLLAGSLFAVHPVHAEVVAWISGRHDLIPTALLLITVLAHLYYRKGHTWTLALFALSMPLALLGKESSLPFLLIIPLYDLLIWESSKAWWKKLISLPSGIVLLMAAGYMALRWKSFGSPLGDLTLQQVSVFDKIQTSFLAIGFYAKHLIFPYPLNAFITIPETLGFYPGLFL